jgi:hypothetical protein
MEHLLIGYWKHYGTIASAFCIHYGTIARVCGILYRNIDSALLLVGSGNVEDYR